MSFNDTFFNTIDSEDKAYWLGFIVADGHIFKTNFSGVSVELSRVDENHLDKLAKIFNSNINHRSRKLKGRDTVYEQCSIHFGGVSLNKKLREYGLTNHKTEGLDGKILEYIPASLFNHFVRGFFDGDGTVEPFRLFFYGNYAFLSELKIKLEEFTGIQFKITKNRSIFALYVCSKYSVYKFKQFLYKDATVFLERKLSSFPESSPVFTSKYRYISLVNGYWKVSKQIKGKKVINKNFKSEEEAVDYAKSVGLDIDRRNIRPKSTGS